jgi:hypothetical protein
LEIHQAEAQFMAFLANERTMEEGKEKRRYVSKHRETLATARRFNRPTHARKRSTQRPHVNPTNVPRIFHPLRQYYPIVLFPTRSSGVEKKPPISGCAITLLSQIISTDYLATKSLEDRATLGRESSTLSKLSSTFLTLVAENQ